VNWKIQALGCFLLATGATSVGCGSAGTDQSTPIATSTTSAKSQTADPAEGVDGVVQVAYVTPVTLDLPGMT